MGNVLERSMGSCGKIRLPFTWIFLLNKQKTVCCHLDLYFIALYHASENFYQVYHLMRDELQFVMFTSINIMIASARRASV